MCDPNVWWGVLLLERGGTADRRYWHVLLVRENMRFGALLWRFLVVGSSTEESKGRNGRTRCRACRVRMCRGRVVFYVRSSHHILYNIRVQLWVDLDLIRGFDRFAYDLLFVV